MRISMLFLACSLAVTSSTVSALEGNKMIIFGGEIYSADPNNPSPQAIAIEGKNHCRGNVQRCAEEGRF